jgi:hypothetical protein
MNIKLIVGFFGYIVLSTTLYPTINEVGSYLGHETQSFIQLSNPSTSASVFLTSNQGKGTQAEVVPNPPPQNPGLFSKLSSSQGLIECQQPFGNPTSCVTSCQSGPKTLFGPTTQCTGIINASNNFEIPGVKSATDLLNEVAQSTAALNYVFLDTIVNNSNSSFEIATTTAQLYSSDPNIQPNTIAGAIAAGSLNIFTNLYSLKPSGTFTAGKSSYPLTFLNEAPNIKDNRYLIAAANKHNPATDDLAIKRHMADKNLALNTSITGGTQTIILFPNRMQTTCQPVIFIGRDEDNVFYALTYLGNYKSTTLEQCCVVGGTTPCGTDTLYPSSDPQQLPQTNTDNTDPNFIRLGNPGRLAVDIECIAGTGGYGYAVSIKSLKGLWYPGSGLLKFLDQPDFSNIPTKPTPCTS